MSFSGKGKRAGIEKCLVTRQIDKETDASKIWILISLVQSFIYIAIDFFVK
jgi:hypothetical protein